MAQNMAFYQEHLDRVSRSFAFCIAQLKSPLREWTALSYLLCRVLDTIEDSRWPTLAAQQTQYRHFDSFMTVLPQTAEVRAWVACFPHDIPAEELQLVRDAADLFADLHALPEPVHRTVQHTVAGMSAGMRHYTDRLHAEGALRLHSLIDLNRYCYFVAGTVGHLLTDLFAHYRTASHGSTAGTLRQNALHFGLFLQKVNILKDQRKDEADGRFLVPDRRQVLASLRDNALGSLAYLTSLPLEEVGYRTFCAWSLFLGVASLQYIEASHDRDCAVKISRAATADLLQNVSAIVQDNDALRAQMSRYMTVLPNVETSSARRAPAKSALPGDWFRELCGTMLGDDDICALGMG